MIVWKIGLRILKRNKRLAKAMNKRYIHIFYIGVCVRKIEREKRNRNREIERENKRERERGREKERERGGENIMIILIFI